MQRAMWRNGVMPHQVHALTRHPLRGVGKVRATVGYNKPTGGGLAG